MKKTLFTFLWIILICLTFLSRATEYPKAEDVFKNSLELKLNKFPDADEILLTNVQNMNYSPDGTAENIDDMYIKIITEKGRNDNRTIKFHFNSHYQQVEIQIAELIKTNGNILPIDIPANTRIAVNHHQMGLNIFDPNQKIITLNIPGLEIGDIIHCRYKEKIIKSRMPNAWSEYIILQSDQPVLDYKVELRSPNSLPIANFAIKDEVKGTIEFSKTVKDDETIYLWHAKNVPQVFPEPDMPPLYTQVQRLIIGTVPTWEDISKWYWRLCLPRLEKTTARMEEEVHKLCNGKTNEEEKIRAIFDFVSQKVRYMGITTEEEAPGYEPHDVCITFENKYGVCRDKAALLVAMLRIAGFKAYPVLIMAGPKKDPEVPNPFFNHAIACVENTDGSYTLMDPTGENETELLPSHLSNKSFLVAKPEGDTLRVSPINPASKNILSIKTVCEIRNDGGGIGNTRIDFAGVNDSAYRGIFLRRSPEQIWDFVETTTRLANSELTVESFNFPFDKLSNMRTALSFDLQFNVPSFFAEGYSSAVFLTPILSKYFGMANFLIDKMGLEERKYPLLTEIACGIREEIEIKLPEKSSLAASDFSLPSASRLENKFFKWEQNYSKDENIIKYQSEFLLKSVEFSPSEYVDLKKGLGLREQDLDSFPIRKKKNNKSSNSEIKESGLRIILDECEIEVIDNNSWIETKKVIAELLDFSGKKEISELKFHFNEGSAEMNLEYAKVISKDGSVKEISRQEINLMDQDWNSTAPRYPPGKILVLSLPGVDIGSKVEFKVSRKNIKRPFISFMERLGGFNKIDKKLILVKNPKKIPLKLIEKVNGELKEETLILENISKIYENLPALKKERDIPPAWASGDIFGISSGEWGEYSSRINEKLHSTETKDNSELKKLAESVLKNAGKDKEKMLKAIRDFTAINIRQAGPPFFELPEDFEINIGKVLSSRYGTSAEIASLIGALLDIAEIKYEFVLCSTESFLEKEILTLKKCPQFFFLNQVLVKTELNGRKVYLNDTNQYAELGTIANEGGIALSPGSSDFFILEPESEFKSGDNLSFMIKIDEKGKAKIMSRSKFYGKQYAEMKRLIEEMTPEYLRRFYQEKASDIMISAKISGETKNNFSSYPGYMEFTVESETFAKIAENRLSFVLPGKINILEGLQVSRKNPFLLRNKPFLRQKYIIAVPDSYEIAEILPPKNYTKEFPCGTLFKISSRVENNEEKSDFFGDAKKIFVIEFSANFASEIFEGESYFNLLKKISEFNSNRNAVLVFRKKD